MIRHVVLMNFRPDLAPARIDEAVARFLAMRDKTGEAGTIEHGINNSAEGLDQGFTHCFLIGFPDQAGRDRYLAHPAHKEFAAYVMPLLANGLVVDFEASSAAHKAA
jgi:hypothetical protein